MRSIGPLPVGVLADRVAGLAEARRRDRVGAVLRDSRAPPRRARARGRRRSAGSAGRRRRAAGRGRSRGRSGRGSPRSEAPPWVVTVVSSSPATTWALVTIRPGRAAQPEPSTPSPQAVPSTRTTEPPAPTTSGSVGDRRRRARATGAAGPMIEGAGSTRSSAFRTGARGRQHFVEAAQDHRALDVGAQPRGPRRVQGDGAEDPGQRPAPPRRSAPRRPPRRRGAGAVPRITRARSPRAKPSSVTATRAPTSSAPSAAQSGA